MNVVRRSKDRGVGNISWLDSRYSFSFADYFDRNHMGFGPLRVINEDVILGGSGFGTHPHKNMEIITFMISGALRHKDSMGNEGVVRPGEIQYMSAGTGVAHSEFNDSTTDPAHLLQIWIKPSQLDISPNYGQDSFLSRLRPNELCLLVSSDGRGGSVQIQQDLSMYLGRLDNGSKLEYRIAESRKVWIQLVRGTLVVDSEEIYQGDGIALEKARTFLIYSSSDSEFLLLDLC